MWPLPRPLPLARSLTLSRCPGAPAFGVAHCGAGVPPAGCRCVLAPTSTGAGRARGFLRLRPSGPPSASRRRAISVVGEQNGKGCDHADRAPAACFAAGGDAPGGFTAGVARRRHCARGSGLLEGLSLGTMPRPARPGGGWPLPRALSRSRFYFTPVPGGTSSSADSRYGAPSMDAARSIPRDSTPMSLVGWRLATTTMRLPTRSAGE